MMSLPSNETFPEGTLSCIFMKGSRLIIQIKTVIISCLMLIKKSSKLRKEKIDLPKVQE